jgi:hypothetical protein
MVFKSLANNNVKVKGIDLMSAPLDKAAPYPSEEICDEYSEIAYKVAIISRNIARSKEAMTLLPREIWIILKQIRHPGIVSLERLLI